jgi:hypothetical protein
MKTCKKCDILKLKNKCLLNWIKQLREVNKRLKKDRSVLCAFVLQYLQTVRNETNRYTESLKRFGGKKQYHNYYNEINDLLIKKTLDIK